MESSGTSGVNEGVLGVPGVSEDDKGVPGGQGGRLGVLGGQGGGREVLGVPAAKFDGSSKAVQKILNVKWGQRGHLRVQHPRGARHSVDLMMWPLGVRLV